MAHADPMDLQLPQDDDSKDAAAFRNALKKHLPTKVCACCSRRHPPTEVHGYRYFDLKDKLTSVLAKNIWATPDCLRDGNTLWVPPNEAESATLLDQPVHLTSVPGKHRHTNKAHHTQTCISTLCTSCVLCQQNKTIVVRSIPVQMPTPTNHPI